MSVMGEGIYKVNEKVHSFLPPEVTTTRIIHKIPSWFSAATVRESGAFEKVLHKAWIQPGSVQVLDVNSGVSVEALTG